MLRRVLKALAGAFLVVLLLAVAAGGAWVYLAYWLKAPGPLHADTVVQLPPGAGVQDIAQQLAGARAVDSALLFQLGVRLEGRERQLKAGEYALKAGISPNAIIDLLRRGEVLLHKVVIPEGLTVREAYAVVQQADFLAGDLPPPVPEGTLLPATYSFPRGEPRAKAVERMHAGMEKLLADLWPGRAPDLPLATPEQALTLASIIEKETALPAEYPLVASVFVNRLKKGMRLQTDPTVIYGLTQGAGPLGRELTTADLALESPYNTYRVEGLPPSPIANPGRAALEAALHPAATDYLYFVADGSGGHAFAKTLEEHNRNVAKWRKLRQQEGAG